MMRKLELKEIKEMELNLLVEFDRLCRENHLYYTLCGGTLLGAVRHKGFIPWDDDIDVLMPRPDYDRLLNDRKIDKSGLAEYAELCHWKNGTLGYPFMKLVDNRTRVDVDYFDNDLNVNKIWIDIFPIDGNPKDKKALNRIYRKSIRLRRLLCLKLAKSGEGKTTLKRLLKPALIKILSLIRIKELCKRMDTLASTYDFGESEYIGGILWGYGPQERIHKKEYMTPVKLEFEGHFFNAPSNYHEYLTGLYKDYMQLPPKDKRIVHGLHAYMVEEEA